MDFGDDLHIGHIALATTFDWLEFRGLPSFRDRWINGNANPARRRSSVRAGHWDSHLADVKIPAVTHVASGNPSPVLHSVAEQNNCDLIIMGTARNDAFRGLPLGGTTKRLMKTFATPVLVVQDRPASAYRNILVATDRSLGPREALLAAATLFPKAHITLFNAHDLPAASNLGPNERAKNDMNLQSAMLAEVIADPRVSTDLAARLKLVVETGAVERLLSEYAQDNAVDLTVVRSHGHGTIFEAVIGSTEGKLLDSHAGDLLIVSSDASQATPARRARPDTIGAKPLLPGRDRP